MLCANVMCDDDHDDEDENVGSTAGTVRCAPASLSTYVLRC